MARRQANPRRAWRADATQPETLEGGGAPSPHLRASPFPTNSFRIAWEAARAKWPLCGVIGVRPRSLDIGLCLFLADRPFGLGHLEISFGICSKTHPEASAGTCTGWGVFGFALCVDNPPIER
jgi:hypothetical protein